MIPSSLWFALFCSLYCVYLIDAKLTFDLKDKSKDCYYENIEKNTSSTLEYQVVTGSHYGVDVTIESPTKQILYRRLKSQFDSHTFAATVTGPYAICFSNALLTFAQKLVYMRFQVRIYMDLQVGKEDPLWGIGKHMAAMTELESSSQDIHERLNKIIDYQTHHRLKEAHMQKRAQVLNGHVQFWSFTETIFILLMTILQVLMLKRYFRDKTQPQLMRYKLNVLKF